jgi:hypothetical protein
VTTLRTRHPEVQKRTISEGSTISTSALATPSDAATFDTADGNGAWSRKAAAVARSAEPNVCGPKAGNRVTIQKASRAAPIAKRTKPDVALTAV